MVFSLIKSFTLQSWLSWYLFLHELFGNLPELIESFKAKRIQSDKENNTIHRKLPERFKIKNKKHHQDVLKCYYRKFSYVRTKNNHLGVPTVPEIPPDGYAIVEPYGVF